MMTEIRHNFTKDTGLSAQIIELLRDNFVNNNDPEMILFQKKKWSEKPWYSPTYEGRVHNFMYRISSNGPDNFLQNVINLEPINHALQTYEFTMKKSFVASARIKSLEQQISYIDIEIEAIIILEE